MKRADSKDWFEGPQFSYKPRGSRSDRKAVSVLVTESSWPLAGVRLNKAVEELISKLKQRRCSRVLDLGAGAWLRYSLPLARELDGVEIKAVEYEEAFRGRASEQRKALPPLLSVVTPRQLVRAKKELFDAILLVNVLNVIPEEEHRRDVFQWAAKHLTPVGWLAVCQRVWVSAENGPGAIEYGEGWFVPHRSPSVYTYRAKTGHQWFRSQAKTAGLKPINLGISISANNTLFGVWEKPLK